MTQPPPKPNNLPAVWDLVIADAVARDELGRERYGTRLQPHNGRDALRDAYEEQLDLCAYLRQEIEERDGNMGDNRASIKIEFSIFGKTFSTDMSINYSPGPGGTPDSRVSEWMDECYEAAWSEWQAQLYDDQQEATRKQREADERAELVRLKAKYEPGS